MGACESPLRRFWASLPAAAAFSDWPHARAHPQASDDAWQLGARFETRRRLDFVNGRACARLALRELGIDAATLPRGAAQEPLWPASIAGSITHTQGYSAAVAAAQPHLHAVGIDAESRSAVSARLILRSCSTAEQTALNALPTAQRMATAIMLLSAKESLFKCLFPVIGPIGLRDADISVDAGGALNVTALRGHTLPPDMQLRGRHTSAAGLTLSYFTLTPQPEADRS